jgi:hypothetical protein
MGLVMPGEAPPMTLLALPRLAPGLERHASGVVSGLPDYMGHVLA